ncbi:MAG: alpha/beta hydrolase [Actinomycetota bacterium]|nr:alpha/beta hydrolase [Actinomycetota bacterium]
MFAGFETVDADVNGVRLHARVGGSGPPLLLLHGFPQTHAMWHSVAARLATVHTVVAPDLRGYGDSARPGSDDTHAAYAFRAMAADNVGLMHTLGHDRFAVVGHDRGARVAHRMGLDHPDAVTRLALVDIVPTRHVYGNVDRRVATGYYHWFLFIQPDGLPERLMSAEPIWFLHRLLGGWGSGSDVFDPAALAEYERCFADPDARHAMMEDYRAGASVDLEHDDVDAEAGRRLGMPALVLWGSHGVVGTGTADPLHVWRDYADDVRGTALSGGHFLVEEAPDQVLAELEPFLDAG